MEQLIFTHKTPRKHIFVDWDLSSICNYSCHYCGPEAHDGKVPFPNIEDAKKFVDKVHTEYTTKDFAIYNLLGGEPTIWKELSIFSSYIKQVNNKNILQLLTNGSRSLSWWLTNAESIDRIIVTVHVEHCDIKKIVEKFNNLIGLLDIEFQVAIDIDIFDKCIEYYNYAIHYLNKNIGVRPKPLKKNLSKPGMMDYSSTQIDTIQKLPIIDGTHKHRYGSPMKFKNEDVNVVKLITDKKNAWKDWACWIGIDTINITRSGNVKIGSQCNPNLVIGNIKDCSFSIPMVPVKCNYDSCDCWTDIHTTKIKNYAGHTI